MPDFHYTMEQLAPDLSVCITRDHRFGTDAFLLSDFAAVRRKDLACDLGTGCGIIPLLWFRDRQQGPKMAYGVDIQPLAVEQLRFTIEQSDLGQRMQAVQADLSDLAALKEKLPFGSFDLVTCNPPYKKAEHGILSSLAVFGGGTQRRQPLFEGGSAAADSGRAGRFFAGAAPHLPSAAAERIGNEGTFCQLHCMWWVRPSATWRT